MANEYQISVDTSAVEKMLTAFGVSLDTGFEKTLRQIGISVGRSIDLNFKNKGRPTPFKPLAARTIQRRREEARRTGRQPVAGYDTPLRNSDALRRAAIADRAGTVGSNVTLTHWEWANELTLDYAARQNADREFFTLQSYEPQRYTDMIQAEVDAQLNRAMR